MPASIFADEWRECLRAHYTTVIRNDDRLTERTLRGVMIHEAGFTEAELKELQVRATMRVEDAPTDFVPDLDILQGDSAPHSVAVAMPQEVITALVVEEALERDMQADAAIEEAAEALAEPDALQLDVSDPDAEPPSADAALSDDLMLDDSLDMDESELMDDAMLDGDTSADTPTAELLAEALDVDDFELLDGDESDSSDESEEDEPSPDPDGAQQLSLF